MSVEYNIQANLIEFSMRGDYSLDELTAACDRAIRDEEFRPPMRVIVNTIQAETGATSAQIKKRAATLRAFRKQLGFKWAILAAPGPLSYGLARMFAAYIGRGDVETCVFAERHHACRWLFEAGPQENMKASCAYPALSQFKGWQPYT
jgi:hypothetical protein